MRRLNYFALFIVFIFLGYTFFFSFSNSAENNVEKVDIFLITVESLRADHISCYGYERNTTPRICDFAEDAVLFEKAYSQGTSTPPSLPTILTGMNPAKVSIDSWQEAMPDEHETITEMLKKYNYKTFSSYDRGSNLGQGIDSKHAEYLDAEEYEELWNVPKGRLYHWWFPTEPHFPYNPDEKYRKWDNVSLNQSELYITGKARQQRKLVEKINKEEDIPNERSLEEMINLYDGSIRMVDSRIGSYLQEIKEQDRYEDSMIIITSDHGEFLGEHGKYDHHGMPYEEGIHVPLLIKFPQNRWAGKKIEENVRLVDLAPTVYDYMNMANRKKLYGTSLIPLLKGRKLNLGIISTEGSKRGWAYRQGDYKYFIGNVEKHCLKGKKPRREKLYNLEEDLNEKENIVSSETEKAEELRERLCRTFLDGFSERIDPEKHKMDEETEESLKDLGYL